MKCKECIDVGAFAICKECVEEMQQEIKKWKQIALDAACAKTKQEALEIVDKADSTVGV